MDFYLAIRLRAMEAVLRPDDEAKLRHIHRWYSHQFHTPLHQVLELDPVDVLVAFYEHQYEEMKEEDRNQEILELLETPEERRAKARAKDMERADTFDYSRLVAEEEQRKAAEKKRLAELDPAQAQKFKQVPETSLPKPKPLKPEDLQVKPGIQMRFVSDSEFELELEKSSNDPAKSRQSSE